MKSMITRPWNKAKARSPPGCLTGLVGAALRERGRLWPKGGSKMKERANDKQPNMGKLIRISPENQISEPFQPFDEWNSSLDKLDLRRRSIQNILDSYQGLFDPLRELVQNAVDELQVTVELLMISGIEIKYRPQLWVIIDVPQNQLTVIDNGLGIDPREVKRILIPNPQGAVNTSEGPQRCRRELLGLRIQPPAGFDKGKR